MSLCIGPLSHFLALIMAGSPLRRAGLRIKALVKYRREVVTITEGTQVPSTKSAAVETKESLRQPVWHVVALSVLTCFAYVFYWFYKNWRDLQAFASCDSAE